MIKEITDSLFDDIQKSLIEKAIKDYSKTKCQKLLEIVAEKANIKTENPGEINEILVIDKDSILNAVDLNEFIS